MKFHRYSFHTENFLFASRLPFTIPVIHSSRTHLSYFTFVMLTVLCINIACLKSLFTVWVFMIPLQTLLITEKDSGTKGMYCTHYICLTNLSSLNNFKLSSSVVGCNIHVYLENGLFKYSLQGALTEISNAVSCGALTLNRLSCIEYI
jgi:hypothetical protein